MGAVKISQLPVTSSLTGAELFELVQSGVSRAGTTGLMAIKALANTFTAAQTISVGSGVALTVVGAPSGTSASFGDGTRNFNIAFAASRVDIGPTTTDILSLLTAGVRRFEVGNAGNVTINAPSSGAALAVNGISNTIAIQAIASELPSIQANTANVIVSMRAWEASGRGLLGTPSNHPLHVRTNDTDRFVIAAAGNVTINAPSSGSAPTLDVNQASGLYGLRVVGAASDTARLVLRDGQTGNREWGLLVGNVGTGQFSLYDYTAAATRLSVNTAGNVTVNAPSSGVALTLNALVDTNGLTYTDGTRTVSVATATGGYGLIGTTSAHGFRLYSNNSSRIEMASAGNVTINAPSSGTTLALNGASGGTPLAITSVSAGNIFSYTDGTVISAASFGGTAFNQGTTTAHAFNLVSNNSTRVAIASGGVVTINAPTTGTSGLVLPAGATGYSSLRLPHGAAPTTPVDGDMWTTTAGLFVRINGATVGPLT